MWAEAVSSFQTETMLLAMKNAETNAETWGFSQQPAAKRCSIFAILMSKQLMTRGGSSTGNSSKLVIINSIGNGIQFYSTQQIDLLLITNK